MTKKDFLWGGHLSRINVAKYCIVPNPIDSPFIQSVPQFAGSKQRQLVREEVKKMRDARLAEPTP